MMSEIALSPNEVRRIVSYCSEEVRRQQDGPLHVGYMVDAWMNAIEHQYRGLGIDLVTIENWGRLVAPDDNSMGFRDGDVYIGGRFAVRVSEMHEQMDRWMAMLTDMTALEAYKEFEFTHPFFDGNGRTGKIILNYINGSLLDPIFPPADLFGYPITNP